MENLSEAVQRILPANVWLKYGVVLAVIILAFVLLRYVSRGLQHLTHKILEKKQYIGRNWLTLMDKHKLVGDIFFAIGTVLIASVGGVVLKELFPKAGFIVVKVLNSVVIVSFMLCLSSALSVVSERYYKSVKFPVQGLVQAVKVILWIITIILILSVLIEKEPLYFIGGLTALSAVLMLVFKDPLVGLAAGFQLSLSDSVRVGDWIEMSSRQANGIVTNILLTTVRVRNWDNTLVNIPAYDMVSSSFTNWRGVNEAGSRRIVRSFYIDLNSLKILSAEEWEAYKKFPLIKKDLEEQEKTMAAAAKTDTSGDASYLTNLGVFRLYCEAYLRQRPETDLNAMVLAHELNPGVQGQPLEILLYSSLTGGAPFENFQSEIVEHLLSTAPRFGLRMYQQLGSADAPHNK